MSCRHRSIRGPRPSPRPRRSRLWPPSTTRAPSPTRDTGHWCAQARRRSGRRRPGRRTADGAHRGDHLVTVHAGTSTVADIRGGFDDGVDAAPVGVAAAVHVEPGLADAVTDEPVGLGQLPLEVGADHVGVLGAQHGQRGPGDARDTDPPSSWSARSSSISGVGAAVDEGGQIAHDGGCVRGGGYRGPRRPSGRLLRRASATVGSFVTSSLSSSSGEVGTSRPRWEFPTLLPVPGHRAVIDAGDLGDPTVRRVGVCPIARSTLRRLRSVVVMGAISSCAMHVVRRLPVLDAEIVEGERRHELLWCRHRLGERPRLDRFQAARDQLGLNVERLRLAGGPPCC